LAASRSVPRSRIFRVVRHFKSLVVLALAVLVTPALLFAHARLVKSTPAANAKLTTSPTALTLWFSERPELRFTKIELLDSLNAPVSIGAVAVVPGETMAMTAPVPTTLGNGKYTVSWRTAGADGHPLTGKFSFVVADTHTVAAVVNVPGRQVEHQTIPTTNAVLEPVGQTVFSTSERWLELVALLALVGAVVFRLSVLRDAGLNAAGTADASDRARRLAQAVLVLLAFATLWRLSAQAGLIPAMTSRTAAMMSVVRDTQWGHGWLVGAIGVVASAIGLKIAKASMTGWFIAGAGAIAICLGEALTGHAGAMSRAPLAIAVDLVHVIGASGWVGGLAAVLLCGVPATRLTEDAMRRTAGQKLVRAYHRTATRCVALVLISAVVAAWMRLGSFGALTTSAYGQILLIKIALAAGLLGFGWLHYRTVVEPEWNDDTGFRFRRSAAFELIVGAALLAATAMLISTALPTA
jgi:putative copper export protein/methionine-rich copper-binding protein CopC